MRKAGIMLKKVDNSQLGYYATKSANWIAEKVTNVDVVMFVKELAVHPVMPLFATMSETDIWGYDAPVIATDLASAKTLLSASGPTEKLFYVWDLEWLRLPDYNHEELSKIYNNDDIKLIARSDRHYMLIKECWKEPEFVMPDFSPNALMGIVNHYGKS